MGVCWCVRVCVSDTMIVLPIGFGVGVVFKIQSKPSQTLSSSMYEQKNTSEVIVVGSKCKRHLTTVTNQITMFGEPERCVHVPFLVGSPPGPC